MGKASSGKKVARAARAGGGIARRRNASYGYPAFIAIVVILGVALIAYSRHQTLASAAPVTAPSNDNSPPRANADHWHAAYGFDICGKFQTNIPQFEDAAGIHTHGDGVIHVHPFRLTKGNSFSGRNANLGAFMTFAKGKVTSQQIKLPNGVKKINGDKCNGKASEVQIKTWKKGEPVQGGQIYNGDPEKLRLEDNQLITIAFLPKGSTIPQPPSAPALDQLSDIARTTTTTPSPNGSTTTVPPATTTSASPVTTTSKP